MSRKALSDKTKEFRGIRFDPRRTEQARAGRAAAKVRRYPALHEIPKASIALGQEGQAAYDKWVGILFDAGVLTVISQHWAEAFAISHDNIWKLTTAGKIVPASVLNQMSRALGELAKFNVNPSLTHAKAENKFSWNGFPARRGSSISRTSKKGS